MKLTLEEARELLIEYREHNNSDALETLVLSNIGLVVFLIKKYGDTLIFEDLKSSGVEALIRAINKFDYKNNPLEAFSTYASTVIINQIFREIKKYKKHSHVLSLDEPIWNNKDGEKTKVDEIVGSNTDDILKNLLSEARSDFVKELMKNLTDKEKQVIILRYGLGKEESKTLVELARMFHCSKQAVFNNEQRALNKMRNMKKYKVFMEK